MLHHAFELKEELSKTYSRFICSKRSINYQESYRNFKLQIEDNNWDVIQSVSRYGDVIIGYLSASINRATRNITNISIVRFESEEISESGSGKAFDLIDKNKLSDKAIEEFTKDMNRFILHLIDNGFNKISWCVYSTNKKVLKLDQLFVKRFGIHGREVGVCINECILRDGTFVNAHMFEVNFRNPVNNKLYKEVTRFKLDCERNLKE